MSRHQRLSAVTPAIIVHGGAGHFDVARHAAARAGCARAVEVGLGALATGTAVDAVLAAVRVLEDDPVFNAGIGSVLNRDGDVECDASLMRGADLALGAIAAVRGARQPIDLARAVLDDGEHVLLCGDGVWTFARERGFEPCDPHILITDAARRRLAQEARRREGAKTASAEPSPDPGTVGACAIDRDGHVATATSTGGTCYKRPGRLGDTPLAGCGTYADDRGGAASATGDGEACIRVTVTARAVGFMRQGLSAQDAAVACVTLLADDVGGTGGVICCDRAGRLGAAHSTAHMPIGAGLLTADGPRQLTRIVVAGPDAVDAVASGRRGMDLMAALTAAR
jgi:beta-aspartyl-peptidase (threonine type)